MNECYHLFQLEGEQIEMIREGLLFANDLERGCDWLLPATKVDCCGVWVECVGPDDHHCPDPKMNGSGRRVF